MSPSKSYWSVAKDWCVDGTFKPEFFAHLGELSLYRHAAGSKRDDFRKGYEWPEGFMAAHDKAEFDKRGLRGSLGSPQHLALLSPLSQLNTSD